MAKLVALVAAAIITANVGPSAIKIAKAIDVSVDASSIEKTNALTDLCTDSSFYKNYQVDYPVKTSLCKDAFGNTESNWQALTAVSVENFSKTYFYFYQPLGENPKWTNTATGESSFNIIFRLSMAVTGSLEDYNHYNLSLVNSSPDKRFWKFSSNYNFKSIMESASYRCFDISEFEILNYNSLGGSNSYLVNKRFSWTKGTDGTYVSSTQDLNTVSLDPSYDNFRIYGMNGNSESCSILHDVTLPNWPHGVDTFTGKWMDCYDCYEDFDNSHFMASQTDVFYVYFPVKKTYGELCGSKITYNGHDQEAFFYPYCGWSTIFDQNWFRKATSEASLYEGEFKDESGKEWSSFVQKSEVLTTGLDSNYVGLKTLNTVEKQDQYASGWVAWWNDKTAWSMGYSDKYSLPAIQQLTPIDGVNFISGLDSYGIERASTNPYAITKETNDSLSKDYQSGEFVLNDYYILRFEMRNASYFDHSEFWQGGSDYATVCCHYWSMTDIDVMQLRFYKDGVFYTVGVNSDSGDLLNDPISTPKTTIYSFNWRILLAVLSIVALGLLVWFAVSSISKAVGGKKE